MLIPNSFTKATNQLNHSGFYVFVAVPMNCFEADVNEG